MFYSRIEVIQAGLNELKKELDSYSEKVRFTAIKKGISAAGGVFKSAYHGLAKFHVSRREPPLRRDRRTKMYVVRPHLKDAVRTKIWRISDGSGYIGYIGPQAKIVPHAHLLERGTAERYHKTGHYTGRGPALYLLKRSFDTAKLTASRTFAYTVQQELKNA